MNNRTVFLTNNGNIYCCGDNDNGKCGFSEPKQITKPKLVPTPNKEKITKTAIGASHTIIIDNKNTAYFFGQNGFGQFATNNRNDVGKLYKPSIFVIRSKPNISKQ